MKMPKMFNKKNGFSLSNPNQLLMGIITVIIAVTFLSSTIGDLINATIDIGNVSNMPLSSLFAAGGAVILLIGAGVIFAYMKVFKVNK